MTQGRQAAEQFGLSMKNILLHIVSLGWLLSIANTNIAIANDELVSDLEVMTGKCLSTGLFKTEYCECAYAVSLSLVDNNQIFDFFINSSGKNESEIDSLYKGLVGGDAYSDRNFSF
ncbi:hypothetical protein C7I87_35055 [Mesorhizobium sp. SARCC-RB16n]|nr:hypothetical protein C7I87_35055 [Mesorhizobium sp. SARCC-RB16n]